MDAILGFDMARLYLSAPNLKLLKDQIRDAYHLPSSHLSEALATALGFGSHASLNAHLSALTGDPVSMPLSDEAFAERLSNLGSPVSNWRGFASFRSAAVVSAEEPTLRFERSGPFRMVYNFWLAPNFERVLAGKAKPPFVNHDLVDFEYLRAVIADEFRYGSPVEVRLPNDTIDQVTVHARKSSNHAPLWNCHDFATRLLGAASQQSGSIIDIRGEWEPLHQLRERRHAPPPVLVPIVVESVDAEDGMLWSQQTKMRLGVRSASPEVFMNPRRQQRDDDDQGHLTGRLHKALANCFGTPYLPYCVLDWAASDPLPADYQGLGPLKY